MAGSVARRRQQRDSWGGFKPVGDGPQLAALLDRPDAACDIPAASRAPERPLIVRDDVFRVGKHGRHLSVAVNHVPPDVVGMKVSEHHRVDRLRRDAAFGQPPRQQANFATESPAEGAQRWPDPGVDQDVFPTGADEEAGERQRERFAVSAATQFAELRAVRAGQHLQQRADQVTVGIAVNRDVADGESLHAQQST